MKAPVLLLVDDQAMVAEATKMVLLRAGLQVLVASSTSAAVEIWNTRKSEIALVIADFELDSDINGPQLIQRFQADNPQLKSILFSGYSLDRQLGERIQGVDFFGKPFNPRELVAAVFRLLHN